LSEIRQSSMKSKPTETDSIKSDICVIGDGILATSVAYWLRATNPHNESVTVVGSENFNQSKFNVPTNSQFNSVESIQLSKFTNKFIRRLNAEFKLRPTNNVQTGLSGKDFLYERRSIGLLQLSESTFGESELIKYNKLFKQLFESGEYASELLNSKQLNEMFTWLNGENIRMGRFHSRDDLALTNINLVQLNDLMKTKAEQLGVQYVTGKIKSMKSENKYEEDSRYGVTSLRKNCNELTLDKRISQDLSALTNLKFKKLILACSADQSRLIANMLNLDKNYQWPVEDRQRFIYEIRCDDLKDQEIPVIVDSFGLWIRKDQSSKNFYCGLNSHEGIDTEEELNKVTAFSKFVWPRLTSYIPSTKSIDLINVQVQNYDYNLIDDNGIVGLHPDIHNVFTILGFSGNHEHLSPALGKATSELVLTKRSNLINLDKSFSWRRVLNNSRLKQRLSN